MTRGAILLAALAAAPALGLPADGAATVALGEVTFLRKNYLEAATVDPPDLATAERMPSFELLLTPKRAGEGLVFLHEDGQLEVVRLKVVGGGRAPLGAEGAQRPFDLSKARALCPHVEERTVEGERFFHADVPGEACRAALLAALADGPYDADHLRLTFSPEALQSQLAAMQARLDAAHLRGLGISYTGATLTLTGKVDSETRRRALEAMWPVTLGRMLIDDETNREEW